LRVSLRKNSASTQYRPDRQGGACRGKNCLGVGHRLLLLGPLFVVSSASARAGRIFFSSRGAAFIRIGYSIPRRRTTDYRQKNKTPSQKLWARSLQSLSYLISPPHFLPSFFFILSFPYRTSNSGEGRQYSVKLLFLACVGDLFSLVYCWFGVTRVRFHFSRGQTCAAISLEKNVGMIVSISRLTDNRSA